MIDVFERAGVLHVAGPMTRPHVGSLRERLLAVLSGRAPGELDLSRVTALDSAGIQLIFSFLRSAPEARVTAVSEGARAALRRLGAEQELAGS